MLFQLLEHPFVSKSCFKLLQGEEAYLKAIAAKHKYVTTSSNHTNMSKNKIKTQEI